MGFLRKYWFLIALSFLAVLLLFFWIGGSSGERREDLPILPALPYPALSSQALPVNITIDIPQETSLPEGVSVFSVDLAKVSPEQAKSMATGLGFPSNPTDIATDVKLGDYYLWLSGDRTLTIRLSPVEIQLSQDPTTINGGEGSFPNNESVLSFMKTFIQNNKLLGSGVDLAVSGSEIVTDSKLVELSVNPSVGGLPVVDANPYKPLVTAYAGRDSKVYAFNYLVGFSGVKSFISYPAKTLQQVRETLATEGRIVSIGKPGSETLLLTPSDVTLKSLKSALLFHPESPSVLYPVYVFEGTATTEVGVVPVYVYMPAVKSPYVQKSQKGVGFN